MNRLLPFLLLPLVACISSPQDQPAPAFLVITWNEVLQKVKAGEVREVRFPLQSSPEIFLTNGMLVLATPPSGMTSEGIMELFKRLSPSNKVINFIGEFSLSAT